MMKDALISISSDLSDHIFYREIWRLMEKGEL